MARTRYARSGEVELAYRVVGQGPHDLILVFDWASHVEVLWEQPRFVEFVSALARFGRVILFDMRGSGLSGRTADRDFAPDAWLEDVGAVMDAAGSARATVVAHGQAAQLALLFAATHPERVASLILINGFARLARADDYPAGMPESVSGRVLESIAEGWGDGTEARLDVMAPSLAGQPGLAEWWGRAERYSGTPAAAVARMRASLELDVRDVLGLVDAPTLVVQNRDNAFVRAGHGRYLAEHIRDARLLERPRADHWALPEPDLLDAIEEFVTGARSPDRDGDRVLATVLAVDVAGSTAHAIAVGDERWRLERDQLEQTVRDEVRAYGGEFVASTGDGALAIFAGPARAIRCALATRDAVHQRGLDLRSGLHAGEVTRRDGAIAGVAVHITTRVCSLAAPGEVLVSRTVRDLVAGSGIAFDSRGEHELKGVPDRWTLYAARG